MGQSKRYKGKACAYCRREGISSTNDHVVARAFFLSEDRFGLPQVPACASCNTRKSVLENYVAATLLIGSKHPEAARYLKELVRPRLRANARLRRDLNLDAPPTWMRVNGILQPMHAVTIDAGKVNELMELILLGLYRHHFGNTLAPGFIPHVSMFHPEGEASMWANLSRFFPPQSVRHECDLGRGSFAYACVQSPAAPEVTVWEVVWHGGVALWGGGAPPEGIARWWGFTQPTDEKIAEFNQAPTA